MSAIETLKSYLNEYGKLALYTHITLSLGFFGSTYLLISRGFDLNYHLKKVNIDLASKLPGKSNHVAVSFIIYKAIMPLRIGVTIAAIPFVVKLFEKKEK